MTRSAVSKKLPLPVVADLLADDPRWDESGLLPVDRLSSPLPFEVPAWDYITLPGSVNVVEIFWDGDLLLSREWDSSVTVLPPAERRFEVPAAYLTVGIHTLHYTVGNPFGNVQESLPQTVTVDLTAPAFESDHGQLIFDTTEVTEAYLHAHGNQLEGQMPSYRGGKSGDVVTWYWNENPFSVKDSDVVSTMTLAREDVGKPVTLVFDEDMIVARQDGKRYAFYTVSDRAGNLSPYSQPVELQVAAQPIPRVLPAPRISETSGSNSSTLDPLDAIRGVTVLIPAEAVILAGETVSVQWAEPGAVGSFRTAQAESRAFNVPSTCIAQHFEKSIPVYYEVFENGVEQPHVSNRHTLNVMEVTGFPAIQCDRVAGGRLSLGSIAEGGVASFSLDSWPFMNTDQFINVEVRGVDSANALVVVAVLKDYRVPQVANRINAGQIAKTDLRRFKIGGQLEIKARVSFDGKLTWQPFASLRPTLVG